jgi:ATP-dependent helicase/nuclease subunit A
MDLVALGQSVLTPEDDLTLACVLKSPLFGFDDEHLLSLAAEREGSLIEALGLNDRNSLFRTAQLKFADFRINAEQLGPFGFYSYVLGPCGGRRLFKSRLGAEADDAIDEFLRLALEHEQRETPSLTHFLNGFLASETTVKRDMESGRNEVRVMTVHGAKGLEAPIVYLPDTCGVSVDKTKLDPILNLSHTDELFLPIWSPSQTTDDEKMGEIRKKLYKKEAEEHRRLLYVAMTRPRDRLYISGFLGKRKLTDDSWYAMIEKALASAMTEVTEGDGPTGARRFQTIPYPDAETYVEDAKPLQNIDIPEWLMRMPVQEMEPLPPIRPSHALSAADRDNQTSGDGFNLEARRKGVLIHSLLELLPSVSSERRMAVALEYLKLRGAHLAELDFITIASNIIKIIEHSEISDLFSKQSKAEVAIAGLLHRPGKPSRPVSGKIDRLAVLDHEVLIADFKTSSNPPGPLKPVRDQTVAQLATYRALVGDLYPRHKIRCFVIYTATLQIIEVPVEVLDAGLSLIE